jgi:hypothetical protein
LQHFVLFMDHSPNEMNHTKRHNYSKKITNKGLEQKALPTNQSLIPKRLGSCKQPNIGGASAQIVQRKTSNRKQQSSSSSNIVPANTSTHQTLSSKEKYRYPKFIHRIGMVRSSTSPHSISKPTLLFLPQFR